MKQMVRLDHDKKERIRKIIKWNSNLRNENESPGHKENFLDLNENYMISEV